MILPIYDESLSKLRILDVKGNEFTDTGNIQLLLQSIERKHSNLQVYI